MHPEKQERGTRKYVVAPQGEDATAVFWITRKDAATMEQGKIVRLMELFNVKIENVTADAVETVFLSESYEEIRKAKAQLIHWIPVGEEYPCTIIQQDGSTVEGYAESACKNLKPSTIIQFERFGFVRADAVETKLTAYYAHK